MTPEKLLDNLSSTFVEASGNLRKLLCDWETFDDGLCENYWYDLEWIGLSVLPRALELCAELGATEVERRIEEALRDIDDLADLMERVLGVRPDYFLPAAVVERRRAEQLQDDRARFFEASKGVRPVRWYTHGEGRLAPRGSRYLRWDDPGSDPFEDIRRLIKSPAVSGDWPPEYYRSLAFALRFGDWGPAR